MAITQTIPLKIDGNKYDLKLTLTLRNRTKKALSKSKASGRRRKRTPEELDKLAARILKFIKQRPGLTTEEISHALHMETGDIALPMKKLIEGRKLKTRGNTRATQYTAR